MFIISVILYMLDKTVGCNVQLNKVNHFLYFSYMPYDFLLNSTHIHVA